MRWHRVEDELPNKHDRVLVTDGKDVCLHYKQSIMNWEGSEGEDLYCSCPANFDRCDFVEGSITHWMYLPLRPQEHSNCAVKDCDCEGCQIIRTWK